MKTNTTTRPQPRCSCGASAVYGIGGMIWYCLACVRRAEALAAPTRQQAAQ